MELLTDLISRLECCLLEYALSFETCLNIALKGKV